MAKRLIPTFNRILVEKIIPPSKTSAGILLPEKTSQLNSGKVIAVGPGSRDKAGNLIPPSVKEGDHVLLPEYGGSQIKLDDKDMDTPRLHASMFDTDTCSCGCSTCGVKFNHVSGCIVPFV